LIALDRHPGSLARTHPVIPTSAGFSFALSVSLVRKLIPSCPRTGLAVPECSCERCLTEQLRRFRPTLLGPAGDVAASESADRRGPKDDGRLAA